MSFFSSAWKHSRVPQEVARYRVGRSVYVVCPHRLRTLQQLNSFEGVFRRHPECANIRVIQALLTLDDNKSTIRKVANLQYLFESRLCHHNISLVVLCAVYLCTAEENYPFHQISDHSGQVASKWHRARDILAFYVLLKLMPRRHAFRQILAVF